MKFLFEKLKEKFNNKFTGLQRQGIKVTVAFVCVTIIFAILTLVV